jgi:hypothetical protein
MRRTRSHLPSGTRPGVPLCIAAVAIGIIVGMTASAGDRPDDPAGADDTPPAPGAPGPSTLLAAVAATRAVASARVELSISVPGPAGPVTVVHHAAFTDGGLRAAATTDMSQVAAALESAGQQLDGDWSQPTGVVVEGDTVYAQLGPMAQALGRHPSDWTRTRLADVASTGADNDTLALVLDPLGPLDLLGRPVLDIVEVAAADDVRGEPARHLRARLDLTGAVPDGAGGVGADGAAPDGAAPDGAAPAGGGAGEPSPDSFEARLVAAGFESLPVDVWVGADGMVRRLVVTVDGAETLTTTFDVYDAGGDVTVDAPDPADVIVPPDGSGEP